MKTRNLRAPLAVLPLAILATISHAQTLPETVVTATRFTEEAAMLPMSVSLITAEAIRSSGVNTVNEAIVRLLGIPGRQDFYGGGEYSLDLRGFGETSSSNLVIVLDGIRLNEADSGGSRFSGIAIDAVERIEVLRGSGAVLYGEGATGGVIVITTKAGLGKSRGNSASTYAGAGSNKLSELRANATMAAGAFSLDLSGHRRDTDNHRDNFRSKTDSGSLTGQWSNDFFRLGVSHAQDSLVTGLPGSLTAAQFASNPRQTSTPNDSARIRNERQGLFAEAYLGDWRLAADLGWREKALGSVSAFGRYDYDVDATQYALRARHEKEWGGVSNILVLGHDRGNWSRWVVGGAMAEHVSHAWYVRDDLTLSSGTRLSAGWRTERIDKAANDTADVLKEHLNAWELGVSHPLKKNTTAWARVGSSFRSANVDEFSFTNPLISIRPQMSKDTEVGLRWVQGGYKLDARLYRSSLTDEIGYDPAAIGPFSIFGFNGANINFDPTRRQGMEVDADWLADRALSLGARLIVREAKFRSGSYAGQDVPLVARQTLALRANWTPAAGHRVTGGMNWVGASPVDFGNTCRVPGHFTADARYAVRWKTVELSLGVSNLFDRSYFTQAFSCAGGAASGIYPEPGRTFTAAVRASF